MDDELSVDTIRAQMAIAGDRSRSLEERQEAARRAGAALDIRLGLLDADVSGSMARVGRQIVGATEAVEQVGDTLARLSDASLDALAPWQRSAVMGLVHQGEPILDAIDRVTRGV